MDGVYRTAGYVVSTAILVTLGILFFVNHFLFFGFAGLVLTCLTLLTIDFTVRRLTRLDYKDIGESGTIGQGFLGRTKIFEPHAPRSSSPHEKIEKLAPAIPKVADLLRLGVLDGKTLYHGYTIVNEEAHPLTGSFKDLRTFAIAGKGGSGKSIRLFFLLIQFIMGHAQIYLCDPHGEDAESITAFMRPLARFVHFAITDFSEDIEAQAMHAVVAFRDAMEARVHGDKDRSPRVLVIDEFTRFVNSEYGDIITEVVCKCSTEYRKFQGYAVVIGQEWSAPGKGKVMNNLSLLRNDLHAVFIHRLNRNYAKYFLADTKLLKRVDNLRPGQCFFIDANGSETQELFTPLGTVADAFTVARMLQQIEAPDEMLQIAPGGYRHVSPYSSEPGNVRLLEQPQVRSENSVSEPVKPRETDTESVKLTYTREDEEAVFSAYAELLDELEEGQTITRKALMDRLHEMDTRWNNKRWSTLKAICEQYSLA